MAERKNIITIDPSIEYARMLHYKERHSGWEIFKAIYWGIYILFIGMLVLWPGMTLVNFIGYAVIAFALFFMVYGFSVSLHLKLMKRYG
ncbi:MAG: hypothetical protein ACP5SA_01375 [Candidatus Micrarchaeia archaeon]